MSKTSSDWEWKVPEFLEKNIKHCCMEEHGFYYYDYDLIILMIISIIQ